MILKKKIIILNFAGKPGKIEPIEATKEYTLEDAIRLTGK